MSTRSGLVFFSKRMFSRFNPSEAVAEGNGLISKSRFLRHLHFASLESFFSHLNNVTRFFRYFTRKIEKKGRKERKEKEKER